MRQTLNFNHLECFFSVAETLSFSMTAKALGIAQPAVSKQVKSLEDYFEKQLFVRSRQTVSLTSFGKEVYQSLSPLYLELGNRVSTILDSSNHLQGSLTVGSLHEIGEKLMVPFLSEFKKENPEVHIHIELLKGHEIIDKVKKGDLSIGIMANEVIQENLRCYKLVDEEVVLVTGHKNLATQKLNLRELPYVAYRSDDPLLHSFLQKNASHTKTQRINLEMTVNSHRSMVSLLKEHPYFAVLPKLSIQNEIKNKELFIIKNYKLSSQIYLIYQDVEYVDRKISEFSTFLRTKVKNLK